MPYVQVPGARLHYERAGGGEPLLWITGLAISSRIFDPVLPAHAERFDCITYDNRGAGRSSVPWRPTSMPELAADAVALLDGLGVDAAHVYGLSMGGMVAQEMAIRFPERVRGLVLGGTSPGGARAVWPQVGELAALGVRRVPAPTQLRTRLLTRALFSASYRQRHPDRIPAALALLGADRSSDRGAFAHMIASFYHDTASRLPRVQAPTLVIHGSDDALCPPANARLLSGLLPDAELAWVQGAGHVYLLEQPEEARRLLFEWMDRRSPIAAGTPVGGLAGRAEPLTRALGLPLGAARAGWSFASVAAERLRGSRPHR